MDIEQGRDPKKYEDTIAWMQEEQIKKRKMVGKEKLDFEVDAGSVQLSFALSALHSTTELLKQTIYDICAYKGKETLLEEMREEVARVIAESGWTTKGLAEMRLIDSVLKETQRLKPGSMGQ